MKREETAAGSKDASTGEALKYTEGVDGVVSVQENGGRLVVYVTNSQVARQVSKRGLSRCRASRLGLLRPWVGQNLSTPNQT